MSHAVQRPPVQGYLPQDRPPAPALVSLGLQHVLTMFPATVLVAILTGFDVGVTLFASGLATLLALLLSKGRIPLYYGSSFAYIVPVVAIARAYGVPVAQAGIVGTAVVSVLAGLAHSGSWPGRVGSGLAADYYRLDGNRHWYCPGKGRA